jgi:hypothetical protein
VAVSGATPPRSITFDVRTEAQAMDRSYRNVLRLFRWGMISPWLFGPVLGYVALARLDGILVSLGAGLVIAAIVSAPFAFMYIPNARPRPTSVTVSSGVLSLGRPGAEPPEVVDLSRLGRSISLNTFGPDQPVPQPYPPVLPGIGPWVPWLSRGRRQGIPLSPAAAEALRREMVRIGWKEQFRDWTLGKVATRSYTFRRRLS